MNRILIGKVIRIGGYITISIYYNTMSNEFSYEITKTGRVMQPFVVQFDFFANTESEEILQIEKRYKREMRLDELLLT